MDAEEARTATVVSFLRPCELFRSSWEYAPKQRPFSLSSVVILARKSHLPLVVVPQNRKQMQIVAALARCASARVGQQQVLVESTARFFIYYALRFDVTLFVIRYGRLHANATTTFLAIFGFVSVQVFICTLFMCTVIADKTGQVKGRI